MWVKPHVYQMLELNRVKSFYRLLEEGDSTFIKTVERFIKFGIKIIQDNEELLEELDNLEGIYQSFITDLEYNFFFQIKDKIINFQNGIHPEADFKIYVSKALLIKMFKQDLGGVDAYMRGLIKSKGSLTLGFNYIKFFRLFTKFLLSQVSCKNKNER